MNDPTMLRKWGSVILGAALFFLIGLNVGAEGIRRKAHDSDSAVAEAKAKLEEAAQTLAEAKTQLTDARTQIDRFKAGYITSVQTIEVLTRDLKEARAAAVPAPADQFTVLYESGRAPLNVSLLPFPGAPRIAFGPGSQLAPRWVVPGRIEPRMVGETRQAIYYYFDAGNSLWQGPFAPLQVTQ